MTLKTQLKTLLKILPFLLLSVCFFTACATGKNTWSTRAIQSLNTRFNIYFNGQLSFEEGLRAIQSAHKDDFSQVIPMFPVSNHEAAKAATTHMDRAIEKSRKAIRTRSITAKPEARSGRRRDPNFRAFANRNEFNPFMYRAWLLLAKAEFHKAEFLSAVGTFNYIARHFKHDVHLVQTCQLWVIRSYAEMGWLFEAEEMLSKITQSQLNHHNATLYATVYADLLLKRRQFREAIPFVELVLSRENDRDMKMRFNFLLGQLYAVSGNNAKAHEQFTKVIRMNPPYEMAFNARIARAGLFLGNMNENRRELYRLAKNNNNEQYLDQLYFVIGNTFLHQNDTVKALSYYHKAIENSTRNGMDKAAAMIVAGDLHFMRKEYIQAQPLYSEATKIIPLTHHHYPRVSLRSEVLAEIVTHHEIIVLQDSLQRLSAMTPDQRLQSVLAWIEKVEREAELVAERETARQQRAGQPTDDPFVGMNMIGNVNPAERGAWYFYNTALMRSGETEFQRQWGRRRLEDHWRRTTKSASLFVEENNAAANLTPLPNDTVLVGDDGDLPVEATQEPADPKNPEYYLRQIPVTPEQIARSNQLWAESLFAKGVVYKDKLEDFTLAIQTFDEYLRRFGQHEHALEAMYHSFLIHLRTEQPIDAEKMRMRIVQEHPESMYAQMLGVPNYLESRKKMLQQQDSLYQKAYSAFNRNEFQQVFKITEFVSREFPLSPLLPRFMFLSAISTGKTQSNEVFENALGTLLERFPQSEVSSISTDILALIRQGREAQQGNTHGTILARREGNLLNELGEIQAIPSFSLNLNAEQRLLLITPESETALFGLQFELAKFNFSRFILKDFDLIIRRIDETRNSISVISFDNFNDAQWYLNAILEEPNLKVLMNQLNVIPLIISESDYLIIRSNKTIDDYLMYRAEKLN